MTNSTLDAALAAYSLTRDDLPGIDEAWGMHFAGTDQPLPETADAVLMRLCPKVLEWADFAIDDVIPRSDGTLVVEIDGHVEEDAERYYSSDRFELNANEAREFLAARENDAERRRLAMLRREAEAYTAGERPAWWLLATEPRVSTRFENAGRELSHATDAKSHLEEHLVQIELLQTALDTATPVSDSDAKRFRPAVGYAAGIAPLDRTGFSYKDDGAVRVGTVNDIANDLAEYGPKHTRLQEALDAAHALPDGALREFLIGERPKRTYDALEGTGRKKRTVKKSYIPVSDLVSEHRSATEGFTRAAARRDEQSKTLRALRRAGNAALKEAEKRRAAAEKQVAAIWSEGWPHKKGAPEALDHPSTW